MTEITRDGLRPISYMSDISFATVTFSYKKELHSTVG